MQSAILNKLNYWLDDLIPNSYLSLQSLPQWPQLEFYLLNADYPQEGLPPEQVQRIMNEPAYWAFCWASGAVLAGYLVSHADLVKDKVVIDFGCGAGVGGIAAAKLGASRVICCDIDENALALTQLNAVHNHVEVELCNNKQSLPNNVDVILVADVLYDRENWPLVSELWTLTSSLIIADSRVKSLPERGYQHQGCWYGTTMPDLNESEEFNWVNIYTRDT